MMDLSPHPGCWTATPVPHPWEPEILDCPCGYLAKRQDRRCDGCHRQDMPKPSGETLEQVQETYYWRWSKQNGGRYANP